MDHFIIGQMVMFRGRLLEFIQTVTEAEADRMPKGFNNTIRWNMGHILTVTENFLFGFTNTEIKLPQNYKELFSPGTKPADWTGDVPSLETLTSQLQDQTERIKDIFGSRLEEKLVKPFQFPNGFTIETVSQVISFLTVHEGIHMSWMKALKRVIEAQAE
ncbi:DinB family protein [Paenactinomyces guangxiensis]|uniref:DinB family protein n=1 Tax=Paenactinomyces guangxiensis TaxID=1490290 RepID=A0A7W1WSE2_9BACL|nr:DinB family protein [Paenactinomyces guangxiensis]MBA4495203.1 DinB family protein [Paenactinomyces guangxiensis]MBH8592287.1 DinB family protein [Paenactinomyces guangxiensis]